MKKMQNHGGDIYRNKSVIDFSSNVNPFGPPKKVIEILKENIEKIAHYPDQECEALKQELGKKINVNKDWITCGNGAAELIFSLILSYRPQKVLTPVPGFLEYERGIKAAGSELIPYGLLKEKDFCIKADFLEKLNEVKEHGMVILCNPHNPTGTVISKEILKKIVEECRKKKIMLLIDECFQEFLQREKQHSLIEEIKENPNLVILKAFTKQYALPGIRLGYFISSNSNIHGMVKEITQPWNVSTLAQVAGIQALKEDEYWETSFEYIQREREYLIKEITSLGLNVYGSYANYIFFYSSKEVYETLLEKKILIRNCENYKGLEAGYYRIAVRTQKENQQFIKKLKEVIEER